MHRVDTSGATQDNKFTDGNPAQSVPATVVDAAILNALQEEISYCIEQMGITLAKGNNTQLWQAIVGKLNLHELLTNPHGATDTATANRMALRDAAGRFNVVAPPPFDYSGLVATAGWVRNSLGNRRGSVTLSANTVLTAAGHAGARIKLAGNGPYTITLPLLSDSSDGVCLEFMSEATGTVTVSRQGADQIYPLTGLPVNSFTMAAGDTALLELSNGVWSLVGGSVALKHHPQFAALLAPNGHQMLPSGIIKQWMYGVSDANGDMVLTHPTAFPNGILFGVAQESNPSGWIPTAVSVWGYDKVNSTKTYSVARARNIFSTNGPVASGGIAGHIIVWGY